ncbi:nuclease domain-containing protein [Paenibacillus sp. UNC499MF]|uniref:nuclease domain-containing protein n=1 Tax=Paenibacillus sp. UNC499MF TaxID=1502751 RepID=UPI0008A08A8C|nr:nuclease domain-containing protein [Paenibacillus sp. UNC499MF]SEG75564.1 PD-(D/E)XK nuclease superfamily protein [Paenibacillus sp. UNC499MF]
MHFNAEELPFVLEFFTDKSRFNTKSVKEFWIRNQVSPGSIRDLVLVKENIPIGVRLYTKEGAEKDLNAKVVIQTSTYDENGKQIDIQVPLSNKDDEEFIFEYEDKKDKTNKGKEFPWRLGVYFFDVYYGGYVYSSGINVAPIHVTAEQVQRMHLLLEQEIEGICYDLIYTSKSTSNEFEFLKMKSYYDYVLRLINEKDKIIGSLIQIERNLKNQVITQYKTGTYQMKIDHISLRWKEVRGSSFELNKRKVLSYDTPQNRWLKHVLLSWRNELHNIVETIEADWKQKMLTIGSKEEQRKQSEKRIDTFYNAREISKASKDSMKSQFYRLEEDIIKMRRELSVLQRWSQLVKNMIGRFSFMLYSTELSGVKRGWRKPSMKDPNYRKISDLYEEGSKVLRGETSAKHVVPILKPTWKIYEQFVYFQVVNMLRKQGYSVINHHDMERVRNLESGFCVELENESTIIHVWYDKVVQLRVDAENSGDLFYSSQQLIQPDIRIDLYKKSKKNMFIASLALDAKHRKYKSLHNANFTSIVYTQLSKYQSIFYSGEYSAQGRRRSVVHYVICVYSRDNDAHVKQEVLPHVFIQLFPDIDQDQMIGYEELSYELSQWLEETKNIIP